MIKLLKKQNQLEDLLSSQGNRRNDLYPAQIAMISNFCISHKVGATAGLEAAIVGTRTLLLDYPPYNSQNDKTYNESDIVYSNIEEILKKFNYLEMETHKHII